MSKKNLIACIISTTLVLILFAAYFSGAFRKESAPVIYETAETDRQYIGDIIEYNGHTYKYNEDLYNFLFLGIDTFDSLNVLNEPTESGQSDAMILMSFNRVTHDVFLLQINRNTMVDVDIYDSSGQIARTVPAQITLQYAAATGGEHSIWASKHAVSKLLFDIPIDAYFVMNMNAIDDINDAIGGVDIVMPRDYTIIDSSMTSGSEVHIMGDTATRFVRYRDTNVFNSVADRMDRQVLYIRAFFGQLAGRNAQSIYDMLEPFYGDTLMTNITMQDVSNMINYDLHTCRVDYLPGEMVMGDRFEEFYVDYDALREYVVTNYYVQIT